MFFHEIMMKKMCVFVRSYFDIVFKNGVCVHQLIKYESFSCKNNIFGGKKKRLVICSQYHLVYMNSTSSAFNDCAWKDKNLLMLVEY